MGEKGLNKSRHGGLWHDAAPRSVVSPRGRTGAGILQDRRVRAGHAGDSLRHAATTKGTMVLVRPPFQSGSPARNTLFWCPRSPMLRAKRDGTVMTTPIRP